MLHVEINLVLEGSSVDTIGSQNDVLASILGVLTRNEGKLDLLNTCENRLNNPSADLAGVILNLLSKALSHHKIEVGLPVRFVSLVF